MLLPSAWVDDSCTIQYSSSRWRGQSMSRLTHFAVVCSLTLVIITETNTASQYKVFDYSRYKSISCSQWVTIPGRYGM